MLQKNLMYLAAIADAQPQQSAATSQVDYMFDSVFLVNLLVFL